MTKKYENIQLFSVNLFLQLIKIISKIQTSIGSTEEKFLQDIYIHTRWRRQRGHEDSLPPLKYYIDYQN